MTENEEAESVQRMKTGIQSLVRLIAGAVLAYLFIVILTTASFQASAARQLAALNPPLEYSAGYARWLEDERRGAAQSVLQAERDRLTLAREAALIRNEEEAEAYREKEGPLRALHRRLAAAGACDFTERLPQGAGEAAEIVSQIGQCRADPQFPQSLGRATEAFLATSEQLVVAGRQWVRSVREVDMATARLNRVSASLGSLRESRAAALAVRDSFSELAPLRTPWLGGGLLAGFPPSLTQILLSFVSGLFGALLITLVLIVYPKTKIRVAATAGGFGARVLLGGLISLCVFVVIGGGTAVLGTANAFAGAQVNFMAICAIGILAGMFSDRVAFWLSDRADTFFRREDERQRRGGRVARGEAAARPTPAAARSPR